MSFGLLLPLGLSALAAVIVPLLLHLRRRQEHRPTPFAALRWVRGPARPRKRLRFEHWLLLLLRILLIATIALLIAAPVRRGEQAAAASLVAVVPGVDPAHARAALDADGADWRWLQPGFPLLSTPASAEATATASLLRELDAELPPGTRLHVVVPAQLRGLDGAAIQLSREADWRIVPDATAAAPSVASPPVQQISLRPNGDDTAAAYLRAAVAAFDHAGVARYQLTVDTSSAPVAPGTDYVFWLNHEPSAALLRWVEDGGTALVGAAPYDRGEVVARDPQGQALLRSEVRGRGRLLRFAAAIAPASLPVVLEADFPVLLFSQLHPAEPPPDRASAAAMQPSATAQRADAAPRPVASALIVLIALLAVAERLLSLLATRQHP
ncbi:MAG: BatA domain-containing protein [Rhodanobacteraceae bacterium]|nr:BatA domain-containing protein [Rhodanobacteraceae bacterium]